jgi:hypothetical protein
MDRNASGGYAALKKETTKGTAVTPDTYVPYYNQSLVTDPHLMSDEPIYGNLFRRLQSLPGIKSHGGSISVMAEPNTGARWFDMLATKSSTAGSNPYTHTYGASIVTPPNSYTVDLSFVSQVVRYIGVEASKITIGWDGEKMVFNIDVSALKSFLSAEVASVTGAGPYTVTLNATESNPSPTTGLVVGDLFQIYDVSAAAYLTATIATIPSGTTLTCVANVAAGASGDILTLRPATPSYSTLTPFLAGKSEWRFAATASAALSAANTSVELSSEISIMYDFANGEGTKRFGSFDPATLPRSVYDSNVSLKRFFDTPQDIRDWNARNKQALVFRAFSGATNQYEFRVTLNDLRTSQLAIPSESASNILKEMTLLPNYDQTDGKGFEVAFINTVATI